MVHDIFGIEKSGGNSIEYAAERERLAVTKVASEAKRYSGCLVALVDKEGVSSATPLNCSVEGCEVTLSKTTIENADACENPSLES
ncbi:MAG TPA: hypothetical protein VD947_03555 [Patescibacteria group bacterium]|nr:hypothetical protein [Patescibacteria group bacterium]